LNSLWQSGALGRMTIASEAELLARAIEGVFGPVVLQLGHWGDGKELWPLGPQRRPLLVAPQPGRGTDVIARLAHLPVANTAADAVLLAHALEFSDEPLALLREADRVLMGEGCLIVMGFKPTSPWGWRAAASQCGFPPGLQRVIPERRVRDWLTLLGYEIEPTRHCLYTLPFGGAAGKPSSMRRGWFYPLPAGVYLLKARKRLFGVTPLRARLRPAVLGGALEPTI
jgi:SAM-dependent methyltransferase